LVAVILIILIVIARYSLLKNKEIAQSQLIYTFSSTVDPTTGELKPFLQADGQTPQLSCPAGTKINIIGAFADIFDPYGTCKVNHTGDSKVSPLLRFQCDPTQTGGYCSGTDTSTCPDGGAGAYQCTSQGECQLAPLNVTAGSAAPVGSTQIGSGWYTVDRNICGYNISEYSGTLPPFPSPACGPLSECAVRDASANLAAVCDGLNACMPSIRSFGDFPCMGIKPRACLLAGGDGTPRWIGGSNRSDYCSLPYMGGKNNQTQPGGATSTITTPNLGYTYHGIFTCIP
jgi:hypothetical protein